MKRLILIPLILLVLSATACSTSPTGRSQLMLVSPEQAIHASREAYIQTLKPLDDEGKIDNDPVVTRKVKLITGRLISQAIAQYPHTRNWEWSVKVIDDPDVVNAWCMAGGKMAVYTGLLIKVKPTDDELAQMGRVGGKSPPEFLSTHPAPGNRQSTLRQLAPKMMPYYQQKRPHPIYPL